jgi:hypothetical protein
MKRKKTRVPVTPPNGNGHAVDHGQDQLLTRRGVAARWSCNPKTIQRHAELAKLALRFGPTMIRYRLSDVLQVEAAAR